MNNDLSDSRADQRLGSTTPRMTDAVPGSMPTLKERTAFESALENYQIGSAAAKALVDTKLVLMVSVTAAGRNTIIEMLLKTGNYHSLVSDTTRPMRVKGDEIVEQHGVQYYFRPEEDILADLQAGKFVEAAIIHNQQVSGISVREIVRANESGKIAITDIEVQGCETILRAKPNTLPIFLLPPDFNEWLRRINSRSKLPRQEIRNRLETAVLELDIALTDDRFIFVINDNLERAATVIDELSHGSEPSDAANEKARHLAAELQAGAIEYLKQL